MPVSVRTLPFRSPASQESTASRTTRTRATKATLDRSADDPPILLLEGDSFQVSHDGIARTFYHLADPPPPSNPNAKNNLPLGIEEVYNLKLANKTYVIREDGICLDDYGKDDERDEIRRDVLLGKNAEGLAPMGKALGVVEIQEIDEDGGIFGRAGTGATTWESSLAMGLFFAGHADLLQGDLLEIGSGVGVGAILSQMGALASTQQTLRQLRSITLSDANEECLEQCRQNVRDACNSMSRLFGRDSATDLPMPMRVEKLDWNATIDHSMLHKFDTILACDVCYLYPDIEPLAQTMQKLLKKDGVCHLFGPYNRGAFQHLCQQLHHENMQVDIESLHLERYRLRPENSSSLNGRPTWGVALPHERVYASKSQATILHVTARNAVNKGDSGSDGEKPSMEDLD